MRRYTLFLLLSCFCLYGQTVVESDEAHYDGHQIHLRGNVYVINETGELFADRAIIDTERKNDKLETTHINVDGHVKLIDSEKNQYVLADHVEIFPEENVIIFQANPNERVLFLDQAKQMQLAAHKIRVERGEVDTVQGYGDVRCVFAAEEFDRLKTQFSLE